MKNNFIKSEPVVGSMYRCIIMYMHIHIADWEHSRQPSSHNTPEDKNAKLLLAVMRMKTENEIEYDRVEILMVES